MKMLSQIKEIYMREEPRRNTVPQSELVQKIQEFAQKKAEIIKTWSEDIKDHPKAEDMNSEVGSAFDEQDLDDEMQAVYQALNDGGIIYSSFEHSFWVKNKKKGKLIRVM